MTGDPPIIEPTSRFHAPALALIHQAAFPAAEQWSESAFVTLLLSFGVFGSIADIAGFALARGVEGEVELLTIAVRPAQQHHGLATALLRSILDQAAGRDMTVMFLEVSARNRPARTLYHGFGFESVGVRPSYYPDGSDALVLRRSLVDHRPKDSAIAH